MDMMLRIEENCRRGLTRRALLEAGGLGLLGLSLPSLFQAQAAAAPAKRGSLGRAKNVLFLFLSGGPSQFETFDPKPDAPADYKTIYNTIPTNVPGTFLAEHLTDVAKYADKFALIRSAWHKYNGHFGGH